MRRFPSLIAGVAALSFAANATGQVANPRLEAGAKGNPLEMSAPECGVARNVGDTYWAAPSRPDQSRAPFVKDRQAFKVEVVASGIDHPWAMQVLPNGDILVNIRAGGMKIVSKDGKVSAPLFGTPTIVAAPLAAMYDVRLDKDFAKNRTLYFGYVTKSETGGPAMGRVVRARLAKDQSGLEDLKVIHEYPDLLPRRIVQAKDGKLFITGGEIASGGPNPQSLQSERGKVLRINSDGTIPKDNPFLSTKDAAPALYAVGFRDQEGAALNPTTGELWTAENEPKGGDELNIIKPGKNYGFPIISYGRENGGGLINGGKTAQDGLEQPIYYWTPSVAPSGMTFYDGKALPGWKGNVFIGAMSGKQLVRLELKNGRVVAEEKLLTLRCKRLRDVRQGPDGFLYVITDEADGEVLRLVPAK
jgi:glucose/arabinose dehydrogenase